MTISHEVRLDENRQVHQANPTFSLAMPIETRWRIFNWPVWSRRVSAACFFVVVNWMLLAPAGAFKEIHLFLAHEDKIAHGSIFLALAWLVRWSVPVRYGLGWQRFAVLAALVSYASAIETFQPMLAGAGRHFEWLDMASNLTGIAAGWLLLGLMIADRLERKTAGVGASSIDATVIGREAAE